MTESAPQGHIEWYMERYRGLERGEVTESTFNQRERQLKQFREWYGGDLSTVDSDDIEQYVMHLSGEGYASTTISGRRWALSRFYRQMENKNRIKTDPVNEVAWQDIGVANGKTRKQSESDENERIHSLSVEEMEALANNVPDPKIRNELLIRLLYQTGMRAHEVGNVTLGRIDRESRTIKVIDDKTGDSRTVAYQPSLTFFMEQWIDSGHRDVYSSAEDSDYLFVTRQKPRMTNYRVNEQIRKAAENAGIQEVMYKDAAGKKRYKVTAHVLRHTFAIHALSEEIGSGSMDLRLLQEVMGHDKISTTEKYLQYVGHEAVSDMKSHGPSL